MHMYPLTHNAHPLPPPSSFLCPAQGMSERGFLPKFMGLRSRHDTPTIGILLSSLGVLSLASLNFVQVGEGGCVCV